MSDITAANTLRILVTATTHHTGQQAVADVFKDVAHMKRLEEYGPFAAIFEIPANKEEETFVYIRQLGYKMAPYNEPLPGETAISVSVDWNKVNYANRYSLPLLSKVFRDNANMTLLKDGSEIACFAVPETEETAIRGDLTKRGYIVDRYENLDIGSEPSLAF